MSEIDDTGKVWVRGSFKPEYAVRVGDKVFIPGKEEAETIHCWVRKNQLCVDLHNNSLEKRRIRWFGLELSPTTPGTLFNGFDNTHHADILVVTYRDKGVKEFVVEGEAYRSGSIEKLDSASFCDRVEKKI